MRRRELAAWRTVLLLRVALLCFQGTAATQQHHDQVRAADGSADRADCVVHGVATASCFGYNSSDATESLQAALADPRVQLLRIDNPGAPWVVRPLFIQRDHLRVEFAAGVEILAKRNEFHWTNDCLLTIDNATNVTLSGYGAVLRMHRADCESAAGHTYSALVPASIWKSE